MLLTFADVCVVAGVSAGSLRLWCEKKIVVPFEDGAGCGNHRRFNLMQTVGVAVAIELRKSKRGCALAYVGEVVEAFGKLTEEDLQKKFAKGVTHFMTVVKTQVIMDGPIYGDMINVQRVYENVKQKIVQLSRKPANLTGRNRGLAGVNS